MMRGVGGPLLTIGDLLSDLAVDGDSDLAGGGEESAPSSPSAAAAAVHDAEAASPSDLHRLFEEYYDNLMKSLQENDPSWPGLILKLCAALKTADKLVSSANLNSELLLEKVAVLERVLERGEHAVAMVEDLLQSSHLATDQRSPSPRK